MRKERGAMTTGDNQPPATTPPSTGLPRWLLIGFAVKIILVVAITGAVLWWAGI